jgi:hypothetical protein
MTAPCTCPHKGYHRRHATATNWHCTGCARCGLGQMLHDLPHLRAVTPKTRDRHPYEPCNCQGDNT